MPKAIDKHPGYDTMITAMIRKHLPAVKKKKKKKWWVVSWNKKFLPRSLIALRKFTGNDFLKKNFMQGLTD